MQVSLSYHDSLGCAAVSADDGRRAADDGRGQWGVDGVGKLCELWMLFPDVLNHLGLKTKCKKISSKNEILMLIRNMWVFTSVQTVLQHIPLAGLPRNSYLAAVLFGTVRAADGCSGDGAGQLGVRAQHGVGLTRCSRTQLPDAGRQFSTWVVLQYVSFPLTGTLVHLQKKADRSCLQTASQSAV